ncbi:MAG: YihY/virulence factor BrkB family protein [Acutalibacteraceae bacterium]|jgi:membrane protein
MRSAWQSIRGLIRRIGEDAVGAYAAQAAFFILISAFPFAMLLIGVLRLLPVSQNDLSHNLIRLILPETVSKLVESTLRDAWNNTAGSATVISITAISALWASSKGFLALSQGLNAVYHIEKRRSWPVQKLLSTLYTVSFAILLIATLLLLVFGNSLYRQIVALIPDYTHPALLVISLRSLVGFVILALFFLLLYLFIPNRRVRARQLVTELPGALISAFGWIGFSYLYAYYIDHFSHSSHIYGSLTAVVLLMLWLYFCMYIFLLGAEVNVTLRSDLFAPILLWWHRRRGRHRQKKKAKSDEA